MRSSREVVAVAVGAMLALAAMLAVYEHPWWHHDGRLAAYDLRTGTVRFDVPAPTASVDVHANSGGVIVLSGSNDCSGASSGKLWAVDNSSGRTLWSRTYGAACGDYGPVDDASSGLVLRWSANAVDALAVGTGTRQWSTPVRSSNRPLESSGAIAAPISWRSQLKLLSPASGSVIGGVRTGGPAYPVGQVDGIGLFRIGSGVLAAVDLHTGRRRWSVGVPSDAVFQTDASAGGTVMVSTSSAGFPSFGPAFSEATAFDMKTGRRLWRITARTARTFGLAACGAGVAVFGGAGTLVARDVRNGRVRWTRRWPNWTGRDAGSSEAAADEGTVVVVDPGMLTALDARTGAVRWSHAIPTAHVATHPAALIRGNRIYLPTDSTSFNAASD